ncbi:hypothetical protein AB0C13_18855 [Streptomyces sp. NPDC049099]|uniref:hypothetical protein n=1 Tax=Streptomyces sp. NPDC049099 TaxID=3155768 RepID=UPI0034358842
MTTTETPRDTDGEPLCAWCGDPIKQSGVGRRRAYCSRTHREYAYRDRRDRERLLRAYSKGRADERSFSSVDERKDAGGKSVPQPVAPLPRKPKPLPPEPLNSDRRRSNMSVSPMPLCAEEADGE